MKTKMGTYFIIAIIGIVLFAIGAIGMRMNMSENPYLEHDSIDTFYEEKTPIIGYESAMSTTSGDKNIVIGLKPLTTLYKVDTIVFCKKCNKEHFVYYGIDSKISIYKAKCGEEFELIGKKIK